MQKIRQHNEQNQILASIYKTEKKNLSPLCFLIGNTLNAVNYIFL